MTVTISAPRSLRHSDVVFAVNKLAKHGDFDGRVGKIQICRDSSSAVFDLPTADAFKLVKFASGQNLKQFSFEVTSELPELQTFRQPRRWRRGLPWRRRRRRIP